MTADIVDDGLGVRNKQEHKSSTYKGVVCQVDGENAGHTL